MNSTLEGEMVTATLTSGVSGGDQATTRGRPAPLLNRVAWGLSGAPAASPRLAVPEAQL